MTDKPKNQQDAKRPRETAGYVQYLHKRCHDCGRFLKRELWVSRNHRWKKHALCSDCYSAYDDPRNM